MRSVEIKLWDDVHYAEDAEKVEAVRKTRLVYQDGDGAPQEVVLDLTTEHADLLASQMARWIKAGHPPEQGIVLTRGYKAGSKEARDFYAGLRAWAKSVGRDGEHWTQGRGGREPQYYYPRGLVRDYEAYLIEQAERQAG
jgi:hypothetical protein